MEHIRAPETADDYALVGELLTAPDVKKWLSSEWRNDDVDPTILATLACRNRRNKIFFVLDDDKKPCGIVGLADIDPDGSANWWGAMANVKVRGKGLMSRASAELIDHAFNDLGMQQLHGWFMEHNDPCRKLCERMGFKPAGVLRDATTFEGKPVSRVYYDKTRAEHLGEGG